MFQHNSSLSSVRKPFLFLPVIIFSLCLLSSCKTDFLKTSQNPEPVEKTQITPQAPVVVNGIRTSYADIVDRVAPAVVKINVEIKSANNRSQGFSLEDFFRGAPQSPQRRNPQIQRGTGSGVIVSADGTVLTNQHVIEGASSIKVELNDKKTFTAKVVGSDKPSDLAVLKIEAGDLPFLNFSNSDEVRVGDIVLAIGNPLGIGQSVTEGIISAKGRQTGISDGSYEDFLQTDAPINQGNSGGALINLNGELIGINSQILSMSGGNIGIGFAIPSNMAKSVMEQLLKDGKVRRGRLGVTTQSITEDLAKSLDLGDTKGVLINDVLKGSAAENAGIKRGDVITAVNGEKIEDGNVLRNKIAATLPGTEVEITLNRGGKEEQIIAKLDEFNPETGAGKLPGGNNSPNEQSAQSGKLGLELQPLTPDFAQTLGLPTDTKGLVIINVAPDSPASEASLAKGDVILEINRQKVETVEEAQAAIEKSQNRPLALLIARRGQTVFITVNPR